MLERDIEARLVKGVKALGGKCYKFVSPGNIGVPDRVAVFEGGDVVFIELKTERGRLSPMQEVQIDHLRRLGACVVVLRGMADVLSFLDLRRARKASRRTQK